RRLEQAFDDLRLGSRRVTAYGDQPAHLDQDHRTSGVIRDGQSLALRKPGRVSSPHSRATGVTRDTVEVQPETHYARSGAGSVAYQGLGGGARVLRFVPGSLSHVEIGWNPRVLADFCRRLASFSRLILFGKRGTGMAARVAGVWTIETRMDDLRPVMDADG